MHGFPFIPQKHTLIIVFILAKYLEKKVQQYNYHAQLSTYLATPPSKHHNTEITTETD